MWRKILAGAAAGAAGTTALNAVAYLDMTLRGRPASKAPEETVDRLAGLTGHPVPGEGETRDHRLTGLGALSGTATGVGIGAALGALRAAGVRVPPLWGAVLVGAAVMAVTDGSMTALRVTDPRTWSATSWLSDAVPHLAFGAVTCATLDAITDDDRP
jgi:hypothetical protein